MKSLVCIVMVVLFALSLSANENVKRKRVFIYPATNILGEEFEKFIHLIEIKVKSLFCVTFCYHCEALLK